MSSMGSIHYIGSNRRGHRSIINASTEEFAHLDAQEVGAGRGKHESNEQLAGYTRADRPTGTSDCRRAPNPHESWGPRVRRPRHPGHSAHALEVVALVGTTVPLQHLESVCSRWRCRSSAWLTTLNQLSAREAPVVNTVADASSATLASDLHLFSEGRMSDSGGAWCHPRSLPRPTAWSAGCRSRVGPNATASA